jgi:hypothetical protein
MYAGAALAVLQGIVSGIEDQNLVVVRDTTTHSNHSAFIGGSIFGGLVVTALWLWMAWKNRQGRSWARVLSTVFFGFMCLDALFNLIGLPRPSAFIAIAEWSVGLAAIIFVWKSESSQYYTAMKVPQGYAPIPYGYGPPPGYGQPGYVQQPAAPPAGPDVQPPGQYPTQGGVEPPA